MVICTVKSRGFWGLLPVEAVGRSRHQRENDLGDKCLSLSVSMLLHPLRNLRPSYDFPSPVSEWPPHLHPLTSASDPCTLVPIWHRPLNITQEPPTQRVQRWTHHSSHITFAFAFSFQWQHNSPKSSQKESFIHHSLIWKRYLFYCILCTRQCLLVVNTGVKEQNPCP